ncbi:oligosaccharide flippase family protein [Bacteroidales bacterium OttesenSCG-928-B11]|nr:oligosaccharide flippase family protein [Bacteroidales bacterium OttesenSCG-928-B11]MDL2325904.1 oligosaccharide flippase family protein [Bacteroidales bacterium OttesenSCG-928-A14]
MKQKDFVINLIFLLVLNLLIKPFWLLGVDVGVQVSVGAEQYGAYFAIFNFTYLFNMLLDMGVNNFNNRNIAQHRQLLTKHLSGILTLKLSLGLVYLSAVFIVGFIIGYRDFQLKILFWTAINQFLNSLILYLRTNISALFMFKTDSFLSILDRLIAIIICSTLLWGNVTDQPFRIEWFIYSQTAAYMISAIVAFAILLTKASPIKLHWSLPFARMILKKSLPFAILYLLMSFYNRIDSVMLERMLPGTAGDYETGIYASAYRLLDALVQIAYLFSVILLPLFSRMLKEKSNLTPIIKTSFSLLVFFSVTSTVILLFYRLPVLQFLYADHCHESAQVFQFLIPCIIPISFTYIFGTLLTANGNMRLLNITSIAGICVNLAVNLILIPRLHAVGAAIASLSTQSVVATIQIFIISKQLNFSLKILPWMRSVAFCLLLIIAAYFTYNYLAINPLLAIVLLGISAFVFAMISGLFSIKEIIALRR